jgi:hypothetical protein
LSPQYIAMLKVNCLQLFMQYVSDACALALARAGSNIAARIAMMAITTNNSISVNARVRELHLFRAFISGRNLSKTRWRCKGRLVQIILKKVNFLPVRA